MKLYCFKAQAPRRVLALIKYLNISVQLEEVDMKTGGLRTEAYTALNPNMKAPTLVDGDKVIWESEAIMAHLCIKAGSDLWPSACPAEQVEVLQWLSWNDCHWAPAIGMFYFEHVVKATFGLGAPDTAAYAAKRPDLLKYATVLNAHLNGRDYIACGRLTIADFQLASMAMYWKESEMPFENFSALTHWLDQLNSIPAWSDPWPPSRFALK